jgi:glycyl-tRNA synthetase alpha chain
LRLYEAECQALLDEFHRTFKAEKTAERHEKIHDRVVHDGAGTPADEDVRVALRRFPILAAYELCLKCSHLFNLLDARGAISVTERVAVMARIRNMVVGVAKAYAAQRQSAGGR